VYDNLMVLCAGPTCVPADMAGALHLRAARGLHADASQVSAIHN
jgi:hypothetical protein